MPPKVKFQKEEIAKAALGVARDRGMDAVTAREVAAALNTSPRPIFTWYESMDLLRRDVREAAKGIYSEYIERGLKEPIPFLGVGRQFINFAKDEPRLYSLLFLTGPDGSAGGAMEALGMTREMVIGSIMDIYRMDARSADSYFRDLWLLAFSFATLIVTDGCPYSDGEMSAVFTEVSLSVCKALKEIPGLAEGNFDRDALFKELIDK